MRVRDVSSLEADVRRLAAAAAMERLRRQGADDAVARECGIPPGTTAARWRRWFFLVMAVLVGANAGVLAVVLAFVFVVRLLHLEV